MQIICFKFLRAGTVWKFGMLGQWGPVILTKNFLKIDMLHGVLDWQKLYKIVRKGIFLYFVAFLPFLVFLLKNLKNGPSER
jgi:hypothetical protein